MAEQRLPIVNSDDGVWGDILRQYLMKEHVNDDTDNAANGGHKTITIQAGTAAAGTAPLKFTSGTLLTSPEAGAIEYDGNFRMTLSGNARTTIVGADTSQTLTNKTLTAPSVGGDLNQYGNRPFIISDHTGSEGFAGGFKWAQSSTTRFEVFYDTADNNLNFWNTNGTDTGAHMVYNREGYLYIGSGSGVDTSSRLRVFDNRSTLTSGDVRGLMSEVYLNPSSEASTRAWGVHFVAGTRSGNAEDLTGGDAIQGFEGKAQHNGTGTVTGANGGLLYIENTSTGTITNARTLNLFPMANSGGGTVTNAYHIVTNGLPNFTANGQTRIAIDIAGAIPDPGAFTGTTAAAIRLNGGGGAKDGILFSNDVTLYRSAADTLRTDDNFIVGTPGTSSGSVVTVDGSQALTNKRVTPRVSTTASDATPTINTDNVDIFGLTALAADVTSFTTNLSGTPADGQRLWIYVIGTATRSITWGAGFENGAAALPTSTSGTQRLDVGLVWNAATSKWRCMAAFSDSGNPAVTLTGTQTLSNKTLDNSTVAAIKDASFTIQDEGDTSKQLKFELSGITSGNTRTLTVPDASTTLVGHDMTQTLTNKTLDATNVITLEEGNFQLQDNGDSTKKAEFNISSSQPGGTTRVHTLPTVDSFLVGRDTTDTLTNKTLTNPTVINYTKGVVTIGNTGTSQTIDLTDGTVQTATLTDNCTFTMPTATAGKSFVLYLKTGAGGFTAAFTGVKWSALGAPTITTTASKMDILTFVADGTNWYGSYSQGYTP